MSAKDVMKDMVLYKENVLLWILKHLDVWAAKPGITVFVLNALIDGILHLKEFVPLLIIYAELL